MDNKTKEWMVADVILTKQKGKVYFIYGTAFILALWVVFMLMKKVQWVYYSFPLFLVLALINVYYSKLSNKKAKEYAASLKEVNGKEGK